MADRRQAPVRLSFLGAAGTVTGSKYLLETAGRKLLVDSGLFQGPPALRERNWRPLPLAADEIDAVFLTHAHLDHSGYLPVLWKQGFTGPVYCTSGTTALAGILLPDSGFLQEEDAEYARRKGLSGDDAVEPLYDQNDAGASLELLRPIPFGQVVNVAPGVSASFHRAGHILGASWIQFDLAGRRLVFSGDLGRPNDPVMRAPEPLSGADWVVTESTYGDRAHPAGSPVETLRDVIVRTMRRNGVLMIPAFAVGRAQTLLRLLARLRDDGLIPQVPVYLNSPMAIDATDIYCDHVDEHRLSPDACRVMCGAARYVNSADESRALNRRQGPMIVISASGMASGGRILHHFRAWLEDARNTVLFAGHQAAGTRGAAMLGGARQIRVHGRTLQVNAEVVEISSLSAHADAGEVLDWLAGAVTDAPARLFVTHGDPGAAAALQRRIVQEFGWAAEIPHFEQSTTLE
ncbi:MAG: MBL fold metallo-hydrolase [Pseudomonadales bacterium]